MKNRTLLALLLLVNALFLGSSSVFCWAQAASPGFSLEQVMSSPFPTNLVAAQNASNVAIIENVQREDLNAMEEAQGYHALANEFKRSQEEIAKIVGKSRSHVANMMRLTKLPAEVQAYIALGQLSAGHARALIGVPDPAAAAKRMK